MVKRMTAVIFLPFLLLLFDHPVVATDDETADEAFEKGREAYQAAATAKEKLAIVVEYLGRFPESQHTPFVLGLAIQHLTDDFDDAEGAERLVNEVLLKVESRDIRLHIHQQLAGLYAKTIQTDKLAQLAEQIGKDYELNYNDYFELNEKLIQGKAWDLVIRHSDLAMQFASAEHYRADYPETEISDKELQRRGRRRKGLVLAQKGWAQIQSGKTGEGVATLRIAVDNTQKDYIGVPNTDAYRYLGMVYADQGDYDKATKMLAPEALMANNKDAMNALQKTYVAKIGSKDGFEEFERQLRIQNARKIKPFRLKDYQDKDFDFADLNGKVVLLAFWAPT